MKFIQDSRDERREIPYFEDVSGRDGWAGHESEKSLDKLKAELAEAIGLLGGYVLHYKRGVFELEDKARLGFQLFYTIERAAARLDIAALPVRSPRNGEKSLKMAVYMLRDAFKGLWYFERLSPGFAPLMPFMIADKEGNTVSQVWAKESKIGNLLPAPGSEFVEGEEVR